MPSTRQFFRRAAAAAVGVALVTGCAGVQGGASGDSGAFPTRAVEFTVPFPAGGSSDAIGRATAEGMGDSLGRPVVVVNKPGAAGALGAQEVKGLAPDGHHLVLLASSLFTVTPLAIDDGQAPRLDEFTVVKGMTVEPIVLISRTDGPYGSLDDIKAAAAAGTRITYSTTGAGTTSQFAQKLLLGSLGAQASEVPFEGGAPAVAAVLGGQVDLGANHPKEVMEQVKAGQLRILGIFSAERSDLLADVPTFRERGIDVVVEQRRFLAGPAGLPEDVAALLRAAVDAAQADPAYGEFLQTNYIDRNEIEPNAMTRDLAAARDSYAAQIARLGIDFTKGQ
jgi:tripartite-type tricarboxylate transporter receptor subunit TctC